MKRKSISGKKLFFIAYICIFGFVTLFQLISELISGGEDLPVFWINIIINVFFTFIFLSPFWLISKNIKNTYNIVKHESMSKIDFVSTKEYYRDILKKYSIAELSYIDDFNIDYPKDIVATLLSLVLKRKITIENNYITILDFNTVDLKKSEIYVLENIKDGKVRLKKSHDIIRYAESEAMEDSLIVKANFNAGKIILKSIIGTFMKDLILILIFAIICLNIENLNPFIESGIIPGDLIFIGVSLFGFIMMFLFSSNSFGFIKALSYMAIKSKSYKRTDIGEQVNEKIEGLKNYIKDFSILDEREQQELMIWDEYLIYSVLFNQNHKIINELSTLIEAEIEMDKVYIEYGNDKSFNN